MIVDVAKCYETDLPQKGLNFNCFNTYDYIDKLALSISTIQ